MKELFLLLFMAITLRSFSQCEIRNRVFPDGTMVYYMDPALFYWTSAKSLKGCIVTDKENYFVELQPLPIPEKPEGKKLKNDLQIRLSNGNVYNLQHFDTRYSENDTVMELTYLIRKSDLNDILNFEVDQASIDMMGSEGIRKYDFKLHRSALKEQLACFLKEESVEKK